MKKRSFRTRSILSNEQLSMMATAGEVEKDDLLLSEQTGHKWVRAETVPHLFKEQEPVAAPEPETEQQPAPEPQQAVKDSHRVKSAVIAVILAGLAIITVLVTSHLKSEIEPPPVAAPEVDPWETVEVDMAALLQDGNLSDAKNTLYDYVEAKGEDETSVALRAQLDKNEKRTRLTILYTVFMRSAATPEQAHELIALSTDLKEIDNLKASLRSALTGKKPPSPSLCLAVLDLSKQLTDPSLQSLAVTTYAKVLDVSTSEKACLQLVDLYISRGMHDDALAALVTFTERNPESSRIWLELSAHLALREKTEESLEALKKAVKLGGDETRENARKDPRFESLKETWTFKWNTR